LASVAEMRAVVTRPSGPTVLLTRTSPDTSPLILTVTHAVVLQGLLRLATAGAFIGHGAYGALMAKPGWYGFFGQLGVERGTVDGHSLVLWSGVAEMLLGGLALVWPVRALLLAMFV